jgi:hypothetical protein
MSRPAASPIWCQTCGAYIRPGTHGIHEVRLGADARRASATASGDAEMSGTRAVLLVVAILAGLTFVPFLLANWLLRGR